MVQSYTEVMSNWGAVTTWSITNVTAKAQIRKYLGVIGDIIVDYSCWVQSLFCRMGFVTV